MQLDESCTKENTKNNSSKDNDIKLRINPNYDKTYFANFPVQRKAKQSHAGKIAAKTSYFNLSRSSHARRQNKKEKQTESAA